MSRINEEQVNVLLGFSLNWIANLIGMGKQKGFRYIQTEIFTIFRKKLVQATIT